MFGEMGYTEDNMPHVQKLVNQKDNIMQLMNNE
jgi:hypothetical protein